MAIMDTTNALRKSDPEERRYEHRRVMSAGTLAGDHVRNAGGEDLGIIEELMVDVPTGRVAYAVLSFGGFLGLGNKLFAVPWEALTLDEENHEFVLNVDKKTLANAPGFDRENWPDMANPRWGSAVYRYYGKQPYWNTPGVQETPRQRNLTGGGGA
jgi:PRC-barrel domain